MGSVNSAELESNVAGSPSTSTHVIVRSLLLSFSPTPLRTFAHAASASRQDSIEFAAIAMFPCVFALKRELNARSAIAVPGAVSSAASTTPQTKPRTTRFVHGSWKHRKMPNPKAMADHNAGRPG